MNKNRGMFLESLINKTIKLYERNDIGVFHKKEIPITFSKVNKGLRLENAKIKSKSTTDYYGIHNGKFIAFEAKSSQKDSLPMSMIKEHQLKYLKKIKNNGGIAFFIIGFTTIDKYYMVDVDLLLSIDTKSIKQEFLNDFAIPLDIVYPGILDFAEKIEQLSR